MSSADYLKQLFGLDGLTAVVIGGTGVLGGAFAEALARAGAHTLVVGRNVENGAACVERIAKAGGSAEFVVADTTITWVPSGFARSWNWFAPGIERDPGTFRTMIVGLPGRCFSKKGASARM